MVKVTIGVVGVIAEKAAIVIKRAKLAGVVLSRVVGRKVDDDLDAILMGGRNHGIEIGPGIAGVAEVFFDPFEITALVTVIRGRRVTVAVGDVGVQIVNRWRDPYRRDAHAGEVGHLLLNTLQVAAPVKSPICLRCVIQSGALRRVVIRSVAIKEPVSDDLINDFTFEVSSESAGEWLEKD